MNDIVIDASEVTKSSLNEMRESPSKFNFKKFNEQANGKEGKTNKDTSNDMYGGAVIRTTSKAIIRKLLKDDLCLLNLGRK